MRKFILPVSIGLILIGIAAFIINNDDVTDKSITPAEHVVVDGWEKLSYDASGNAYYIDPKSVEGTAENFHALFKKVYSDDGRNELINSYSGSGVNTDEMKNVDYEIQLMNFKKADDKKYIVGAECTFYKSDGSEIPALRMTVAIAEDENLQPIQAKSIGENLFDTAINYLKN